MAGVHHTCSAAHLSAGAEENRHVCQREQRRDGAHFGKQPVRVCCEQSEEAAGMISLLEA